MNTTPLPPTRRRSKVPNLLFKIGAAVTLVSLIMVVVGVVSLGDRPTEGADGGALIRDQFITEVAVPDVVDVHLDAGTYDVVAVGEHLVHRDEIVRDETNPYRDRSGFREPYVAIDRNGYAVPTRQPTGTRLLPQDGYELVRVSTFDVTSSGTYRIVVDGKDGPTTTIGIGIGVTDDGNVVTDATGFLLLVTGLFGLGLALGVLLLLAAGIWLYADRKQPRTPPPVGPPPSGPPTVSDFDGFGGIHLSPGIHTDPLTGRTSGPAPSSSIPPPPPPPPPRRPPRPTLHHGNPPPSSSV